jgi:hypothetical protein
MAPGSSTFALDDVFWATLLLIFLVPLVVALVARVRKDRCLKLLDDHHVTLLDAEGRPFWGDLVVRSQGLEVLFDAPYTNSRGLTKASVLVPADEAGKAFALCRTDHALTAGERARREKQIVETYRPGSYRRLARGARNFLNVIRDAVLKSISVFVGALSTRSGFAAAAGKQKGEVDSLGTSLMNVITSAYDPLLERHIGDRVILELVNPPGAAKPRSEFPGYLVDYTQEFIAVFHVDGQSEERLIFDVEADAPAWLPVKLEPRKLKVVCLGPDAVVVCALRSGETRYDLGVVLLPGSSLEVRRPAGPVSLEVERTRCIDVVCPRARGRVRFASQARRVREGWTGLPPEMEAARAEDKAG